MEGCRTLSNLSSHSKVCAGPVLPTVHGQSSCPEVESWRGHSEPPCYCGDTGWESKPYSYDSVAVSTLRDNRSLAWPCGPCFCVPSPATMPSILPWPPTLCSHMPSWLLTPSQHHSLLRQAVSLWSSVCFPESGAGVCVRESEGVSAHMCKGM